MIQNQLLFIQVVHQFQVLQVPLSSLVVQDFQLLLSLQGNLWVLVCLVHPSFQVDQVIQLLHPFQAFQLYQELLAFLEIPLVH